MSPDTTTGHYARKQLHCPSAVVRWSHGSRFALAVDLIGRRRPPHMLDYGCGDGTLIELVHGTAATIVGADMDRAQLDGCRRRLAHLAGLTFVHTSALTSPEERGRFDVVTCMEVLEHCADDERRRVLDEIARVLAPGGQLIVSAPIEIGPALAGKQMFRALAAWRGLGDYEHRETYSPLEMLRAVLARPNLARAQHVVETPEGPVEYRGHKGFDWRTLETELRERFAIERRLFTPLPWLGPVLNSQVWFVCSGPPCQ
jgi:SAM-dependent methyltransferase